MKTYDFQQQLLFSRTRARETDTATIAGMLDDCVSVRPASVVEDKAGTDFVATLWGGRTVAIDVKVRSAGCQRFWRGHEPEFALERWSKRPNGTFAGTVGWTLDPKKTTEYVLFRFDPISTHTVYLVAFQALRRAFRVNLEPWYRSYKIDVQTTRNADGSNWQSECLFVPADTVLDAVRSTSVGWLQETS